MVRVSTAGVGMLVAWLAVNAGGVARAADASDPIAEGIRLRKAGHDQEALVLFQRALAQTPSAKAAAQLGLCEHALGMWVDAEVHLLQALGEPKDPWIAKNTSTLRADLAAVQAKLGSVEVWGTPEGATVSIDGVPVGKLPLTTPLRVVQGRRMLTVEAPGFRPQSVTVEVTGTALREHIALAAVAVLPSESAAATTGSAARASSDGAGPGGVPEAGSKVDLRTAPNPQGEPASPPIYTRWWFWTAVAGVLVAAGATAFVLTRGESCAKMGDTPCTTW